ncbi:hypothetical protein JM83_2610 [Gillisia sp. Hel_I_86]|uniref:PAS domain-containing sensor histidine kinase n=1 Tax=Gillisia sp. Hel_I_86 TaxID=1249981 RepID=UPI001198FA12|nr:PAS domain-containing sensor histidine kinase [Gillisia sp. Hel_I_86]TVZ27561.1 hypothetical protein JM83_2610 [Gillisia sp. Hel_I_86]
MEGFKRESDVFRILSEAVSEGIIVVDKAQQIVTTNKAADAIFGYAKNELIGKSLDVLIPMKYRHSHPKQVKTFLEDSDKRQMGHGRDLYGLRKDGSQFPVEAGLNPFNINGNMYVMAFVIDITVRKEAEKEIRDLNADLEKKVEERTYQLKEALHKEKDLNELKTKFLSLVSHEFKTPLSGILTSSTLIGKYPNTGQQDKRDKHIKTIQNKVKFLNNIINDFLSIERLESGKVNYKFSTFPLSKIINEVIYDANMFLKDGQKINYPENIDGIFISFDEKILQLIMTNLLNNAVKYSSENSTIDIEAVLDTKRLSIVVKDEGIGVPVNEQKYIFNRYFRAENALLNQGTGIGLNIVKSHLENLGGTITFVSEENKGSTFSITIPVSTN